MARQEKKSFILYESYETQFGLLSLEQRGELITAIFAYERSGIPPEGLSPVVEMAFSFIRGALDRDREEYEEVSRRNSENGKKGGRPKKTEKTDPFSEKPKKAYNDNDNDNGNGNGNDNDNDNDMDNGNGEEKKKEKETAPFADDSLFYVIPPITPAAPPPVGPRLTEKERDELLRLGVPQDYINKRLLRAASFAQLQGRSVCQILRQWWEEDRSKASPHTRWRAAPSSPGVLSGCSAPPHAPVASPLMSSLPKSYDADDFFQAALNRAWV